MFKLQKPEGRNWKIDLVGLSLDKTLPRNLKIEWVIEDPKCEDNGKYRCTRIYGSERRSTHSVKLKIASDIPGGDI